MAMVAVAGTFASCSDEAHWDAYHFEQTQVGFAQAAQSYELASTDSLPAFEFTLYRSNTAGKVTVPVAVNFSDENVLSVDSLYVTFASGASSAKLALNVNEENIVVGQVYKAEMSLVADSAYNFLNENFSVSGPVKATISFRKNYQWTDWAPYGKGEYVYSQFFNGNDPDREVLYCETTGGELAKFKIQGVLYGIDLVVDYNPHTGNCQVAEHFTGYTHDSYGKVYISDIPQYTGSSYEDFPSTYDKESGVMTLNVIYYVGAGYFGYGPETFTFTETYNK